jgi:bacteriophage HK97-gp10 putative tail-component
VAKRRNKQQIEADKIIKAQLNELGEVIYQEAKANSRVRTGRLRDSVNYMVKPDTTLTVGQVYYGAFQDPNELLAAVNRHVSETTNIIVTEINDAILQPFKK